MRTNIRPPRSPLLLLLASLVGLLATTPAQSQVTYLRDIQIEPRFITVDGQTDRFYDGYPVDNPASILLTFEVLRLPAGTPLTATLEATGEVLPGLHPVVVPAGSLPRYLVHVPVSLASPSMILNPVTLSATVDGTTYTSRAVIQETPLIPFDALVPDSAGLQVQPPLLETLNRVAAEFITDDHYRLEEPVKLFDYSFHISEPPSGRMPWSTSTRTSSPSRPPPSSMPPSPRALPRASSPATPTMRSV